MYAACWSDCLQYYVHEGYVYVCFVCTHMYYLLITVGKVWCCWLPWQKQGHTLRVHILPDERYIVQLNVLHHIIVTLILTLYIPASGSLLVREIFGTKLTRTGSIAPSVRHKMSRKSDSPFAFFNKKASNQLARSVSVLIMFFLGVNVHVLYVYVHVHWAGYWLCRRHLLTC